MPDIEAPKRAYKLVIQTREIIGLGIEFSITRDLTAAANTAEITVFNLSEATRKYLQQLTGGAIVELHAGYAPTPGLIFLGKLREITSAKQGADWVTKVSSGDGDGKNGPVSFSIGPGGTLAKAIQQVIGELKQGIGNAKTAILGGEFLSGMGTTFPHGAVVHGRADQELDRLLRSQGKSYSVQNGDIQILEDGRPTNDTAHVLTIDNGLVGSPEIGAEKNAAGVQVKGSVKARSLLTDQIYPGRQVKIESILVNGFFRVHKATYTGQWEGPDWYCDLEGYPVKQ